MIEKSVYKFLLIAMIFIALPSFVLAQNGYDDEAIKEKVDFGNIINSSFHSNALYDEMKVKCHPDRFPTDKGKNQIAEDLFQAISKNKNNYKRLVELKSEARQKLGIKF